MTWKIPLSDIDIGPEEEKAVNEVIRTRWLTMGERTMAFEEEFAHYVNAKHAIAVTNCTAALHLACLAHGIGEGDEVVLPSLTFVATAAAVRYTGAKPVYADIESEQDLNIGVNAIKNQINDRTKAIIVVHYGGYACDMNEILDLAKEHNLAIIEDAAHATGSELEGIKLGTWGDIGCFSFFSNKNMVTGEGGMITTNDDHLAEEMRRLRSHGMTSLTWDRHQGHAWSYDVVALGFNYRLDEIRAAIGRIQLSKLDKNNKSRRILTDDYRDLFLELVPEIIVPFGDHRGHSSNHLMPVVLPRGIDRKVVMESMKADGIQTSVHYPPIHRFSAYKNNGSIEDFESLPITEDVAAREITLPLFPTLKRSDLEYIVNSFRNSLRTGER